MHSVKMAEELLKLTNKFGALIKHYRLKQGLTQLQLAEKSDVDFTYVSYIESQSRPRIPGNDVIKKLAEIFKIDEEELFLAAKKIPPRLEYVAINDSLAVAFLRALPKLDAAQREQIQTIINRVRSKNLDKD